MSENRVRERLTNERVFAHVMITQVVLAEVIKHLGLEDDITKTMKELATFVYKGDGRPTSSKPNTAYRKAPIMQREVKAAAKDFLNMIKSEGKNVGNE